MKTGATDYDPKEELSPMDKLIMQFGKAIDTETAAFNDLSYTFTQSMISMCKGHVVLSQLSAEVSVFKLCRYKNKLNKASFLTKWFWKRKSFQEIKVIRKYNACIVENVNAIANLIKWD